MRQFKVTDEERKIILQEAKVELQDLKAQHNEQINERKLDYQDNA